MTVLSLLPATELLLTSLFLLACILLFSTIISCRPKPPALFPPGPRPLPLIGSLHLLDLKHMDTSMMKLSKKYGNVFSIDLAGLRVVVLTGYSTVQDALVNLADQFSGRPHNPLFDKITFRMGVIFSDGKLWQNMRKLVLSTLHGFGMGRPLQDRITEEVGFLVSQIEDQKGQPFETLPILTPATGSVICSIIFGNRFECDEERFLRLVKMNTEILQLMSSVHVQIIRNRDQMHKIIADMIQAQDNRTSVSDKLLFKLEQESEMEDVKMRDRNTLCMIMDLLVAGTETTSTTLSWGLLLMSKYPKIQKKVQAEIDQVIECSRCPRIEDKRSMPYTTAVIHEIQRFTNIVPLNLPHSVTTDTYFRGYLLPKGTYVMPILTSVLQDKTQWEKPEEFYPPHFLDGDGKFVKRVAFMPFSAGRRMCAGKDLAKMEIFLFFTSLLQRFNFQCPPGEPELDLTPQVSFIQSPRPHKLCAIPR
ncbi:cytochrome P450 2K6-like isoform X2 [Narcine bancroftii]|uniref:cytochrome P450 2K6-like isoform X2 n=1 Tax=Narcine bancroftii TaxID=1343680 RepID=UPI00383182BD